MLPLALSAALLAVGCTTAAEKKSKKDAESHQLFSTAITESFAQLADGMVSGDMAKVRQYVSDQEWDRNPFDQFAQEYKQNKVLWQAMFRGAVLKTIGVDNNIASAIVIWGTSDSGLLEFIHENGVWKLLNMSAPAPVITPAIGGQPPIPQ